MASSSQSLTVFYMLVQSKLNYSQYRYHAVVAGVAATIIKGQYKM